jgi:hypothetical protein
MQNTILNKKNMEDFKNLPFLIIKIATVSGLKLFEDPRTQMGLSEHQKL